MIFTEQFQVYLQAFKVFSEAKKNKLFRELMMRTTETEKHVKWKCDGQEYHGYVDMVGDTFIADIKTTTDCGGKFERELWYNDMPMQGAMYLEAFENKDYYIIAMEKNSPYNVQVYRIGNELLDKGRKKYLHFNEVYKQWDGMPQSYSAEIIDVGNSEDDMSWMNNMTL